MADWKKVVVSGSSISQLVNDSNYIHTGSTNVSLTGSFSGSFLGDVTVVGSSLISGAAQIASEISGSFTSTSSSIASDITSLDGEVTNIMASTGSVYSHVSGLLSSTGSNYAHIANINSFTGSFSSSVASEIAALESFSSSLDATFATEAELNTATASLSASLAADISTNENNITALDGEVTSLMAFTGSFSSSVATEIKALEDFSSSLDATFATEAELNTATASLSSSLATDIITNVNNITALDGEVTNLMAWTGSAGRKSEISGSFTQLSASIAADIAGVSAGALETGSFAVTLSQVTGSIAFTEGLEIGDVYDQGSGTTDIRVPNGASWLELNYADSDFIWLDGTDAGITLDNNYEWRFYGATGTFIAPGEIRGATISGSTFIVDGGTIVSASAQTIANLAGTNIISGSGQLATVANVATTISGSSTSLSSSLATRLTTVEGSVGAGGLLSSSAQIASEISGSFTATSASIASDIATNVTDISALQTFSQSFDTAFNLSGTDVTIAGNLTVAGTTTTVDSTTVDIGDNIIALNGTGATKGGLAVNDGPASGSLLWDGDNDYWVAGPTGSEVKILLASGDGVLSGSAQIASEISGSITSFSSSIAGRVTTEENNVDVAQAHIGNIHAFTASADGEITALMSFTGSFSSSVATEIKALEDFSSSLDTTFATEAELNTATASLSASLAVDIIANENNITALDGEVTNLMAATGSVYSHVTGLLSATGSNYAHIANINSFTGSFSSSVASEIAALEAFSSSLDASYVTEAELVAATASLSASLATKIAENTSGILDLETFSSSLESTVYNYTGSFSGDGSGLTGLTVTQNATVTASFTSATTASITHNFNSDNVIVTVYDSTNQQFIPSTVWTKTADIVEIHFESAETGRAVVARGGHIVSGSIPFENIIAKPDNLLSGSAQLATIPNMATTISGSFTLLDGEVTSLMAFTGSFSSSVASEIAALEAFSSSLDAGFVTEAELVTATASLSASLATDIASNLASITATDGEVTALMAATGSNYAHISNLLTWTGSAGRKSEISGSFTDLSASIATTISGLSQTLDVSGSDATGGSIDLLTQDLTITGANNEIETTVSGQTVTIGFVTNPTVSGNLTVTGDLTVTGNTIEQQVTNLNVEDQFILLNSGSAAADAGIVVNGQGAAFGWDESENRWALDFEGATWNQTTITSDAYVAAVVTSDDANYQKVGNIRVQGGEVYIYV